MLRSWTNTNKKWNYMCPKEAKRPQTPYSGDEFRMKRDIYRGDWINPRHSLPHVGDLIWILIVEHIGAIERKGCLPSAKCLLGEVDSNKYGILMVTEINHKGFPHGAIYSFYEWAYGLIDMYDYDKGLDEVILAWAPADMIDIPHWEVISISESKAIIEANPRWQLERAKVKANCDVNPRFIYLSDHIPLNEGVYVVANSGGVWLLKYTHENGKSWIAPNGLPVVAWYPIPEGY